MVVSLVLVAQGKPDSQIQQAGGGNQKNHGELKELARGDVIGKVITVGHPQVIIEQQGREHLSPKRAEDRYDS